MTERDPMDVDQDVDADFGEPEDASHRARKVFFVAVYLEDLAYGGPEEGGWYYTAGALVRVMSRHKNEKAAYRSNSRLRRLLDKTLNKGRRPISSVLSEGRYTARVYEDLPPRAFPEIRPHYE